MKESGRQDRYDVVCVIPYYYPETTGHCQSFNSLLPGLVQAGYRVAAITSNRLYASRGSVLLPRETVGGVDIFRVDMPDVKESSRWSQGWSGLQFACKVMALCLSLRYRLILTITSPPFLYAWLGWIAVLRKVPLVLWAMDLYPETLLATDMIRRGGLMHRFGRKLAGWGYAHCAHILTLGPAMRDTIVGYGIPADRITVVHNWMPEEVVMNPAGGQAFRRELGLEGRLVLIYTGNMGWIHEFDGVMEAAFRLQKEIPEICFLMVGHGVRWAALEQQVKDRQLKNVRFMDPVSLDRYADLLSMADAGLVCLGRGMEGVAVPGKVYGYLKIGMPVLILEWEPGDLSGLIGQGVSGASARPDDVDSLVAFCRTVHAHSGNRLAEGNRNRDWYEQHCGSARGIRTFAECLGRFLS